MKQAHKARIEKAERSAGVGIPEVRVVIEENGAFYTFSYPHDSIPAETVEQWERQGHHVIRIDFVDARL